MILSSQLLIDNIPMITLKLHGNFFFFDEQMKALKIKKKKSGKDTATDRNSNILIV